MSYESDLLQRYLKKGENNWEDIFKRVAKFLANNNEEYDKFFNLMNNNDFYPNTPLLLNAGTSMPMASACFAFAMHDSMDSILQTFKEAARTQYLGGGTGISFDKLRHSGAPIKKGTRGNAMGVVNTIRGFDGWFKSILQGGLRRSASMGVINCDHPEIFEFIKCKDKEGEIATFNISVGITDRFMKAVENEEDWDLIDRKTKKAHKTIKAKEIWDLLCQQAYKNGEPGLLFLDTINKLHPLPEKIVNTNPCGEAILSNNESCILGSINLVNHVLFDDQGRAKGLDLEKLKSTVREAVVLLNKVIDKQMYPLKKIERKVKKTRKIGLGLMGFATVCCLLDIEYGSKKCYDFIDEFMSMIKKEAYKKSKELVQVYGSIAKLNRANTLLLSIAPTGSISRIANIRGKLGCSFGIEPYYAEEYKSNILDGSYSEKIKILSYEYLKKSCLIFANDLTYKQHIKVQARFQNYVDHSISKTINLPFEATMEDVSKAFVMAYRHDCKGITVYRSGSRKNEVLEQKKHEGCVTGSCEL